MSIGLITIYLCTLLYGFLPAFVNVRHGILMKKNKFWIWCTVLLCVLSLTSESYADIYNYNNYYDDVTIKGWPITYRAMPILWGYMCRFCGNLGITYRGMILLLIFFSMYLIHCVLDKIDIEDNIFWSFFLIFPGIIQVVQLRFFVGSSIAFFGFSLLFDILDFNKKTTKKVIGFLMCIVLAFFIHNACVFMMVLMASFYFERVNVGRVLFISLLGIIILGLLIPLVPRLVGIFIDPFYLQRYFTQSSSKTTAIRFMKILLVWVFNVGVGLLIMRSNNNLLSKKNRGYVYDSVNVVGKCFSAICLLGISIPLLYFDENFHRYFEIGFMMLYILYAKSIKAGISRNNKLSLFFMIMIVLGYCIYVYYPFETTVIPLFSYDGWMPVFR